MWRTRKSLRWITLLSLSALVLTACGADGEEDDAPDADAGEETTEEPEGDAGDAGEEEPEEDGEAAEGESEGMTHEELVAAAEEEGGLTWYTAAALEASSAQAEDFMEAYPNVDVEVFRQTGGPLSERFMADEQRDATVADALLHSDPAIFVDWAEQGLIAEYRPPGADELPEQLLQFEPFGYPDRIVTIALAYNGDLVTDEQEEIILNEGWEALAHPSFAGQVALIDPALTGSGFNHWSIMVQELGMDATRDLLERIAENDPVFFESNVPATGAVGSGEYLIAPVVEFFPIDQVALGAPVKMAWPEPVPAYYGIIGAIADAPNPNAGRLFVDWMMSREGQAAWVENYNIKSANPNVEDTRAHTEADWFTGQPTIDESVFIEDLEAQEAGRDDLYAMFDEIFQRS